MTSEQLRKQTHTSFQAHVHRKWALLFPDSVAVTVVSTVGELAPCLRGPLQTLRHERACLDRHSNNLATSGEHGHLGKGSGTMETVHINTCIYHNLRRTAWMRNHPFFQVHIQNSGNFHGFVNKRVIALSHQNWCAFVKITTKVK